MARSLLDYVQIIMDDMGSDSVNDFGDSLEAQRVASILRRTFFDLMAEQDLPTADELFALTALSDPTRPTHMQVDTSVRNINWIQYDNRADATDDQIRYIDIDYMDPQVFFRHVWGKNSTDAEILVVDATPNVKLAIQTNANPRFWTSFDGETIIFDAIDQTISTTLSKLFAGCRCRSCVATVNGTADALRPARRATPVAVLNCRKRGGPPESSTDISTACPASLRLPSR